jgi:hypothetical protein
MEQEYERSMAAAERAYAGRMTQFKQQVYTRTTGKPLPEMTEAEFRFLGDRGDADAKMKMEQPTRGSIVNPAKLVGALREGP